MASVAASSPVSQLEQHRSALTGHCYRMLGSVVDAEDAVQETLLRAWKAIDGFQGQASVKTWLYRIATNVCLDTLESSKRMRVRPTDAYDGPVAVTDGLALGTQPREHWVEPIPDVLALPVAEEADPAERAILKESIRLAFVAALQYLPPRQRAVLLLTQVLAWSAAETAEALGMSVAAVNSAVQRARATLDARNPAVVPRTLTKEQETLLARYVEAFERYDIDALSKLLHEEATMSMPPYELWLRGRESVAQWMLTYGIGCRGSRLLPVQSANGLPAFVQYRQGGAQPWAVVLLEVDQDRVTSLHYFLDTETLFGKFGMPAQLV
ncbi:MAG: sigma-70 family RNA polymerase sigma factor [Gemmatimonadaceae bacterium]